MAQSKALTSSAAIVALTLLAGLATGPLRAAEPPALFATGVTADAVPLTADQRTRLEGYRTQRSTLAVTPVRLRGDALRAASAVTLNLPGRRATVIDRVAADRSDPGAVAWSGAAGAAFDPTTPDVMLVVDGADVTGTIHAHGRLYALRPLGDGLQALIEVDAQGLPPDHPPGGPLAVPRAAAREVGPDVAAAADSAARYRVLVAYTPAARRASGNIGALIRLAIEETNRGYLVSGVRTRAVLAGTLLTGAAEGASMDRALARLQRQGDGALDNVHARRNRARADVVILISAHGDYCGISYLNPPASFAFGVVSYSCATGYYSFAHEIGHIQGARHNPEADPTNTPFPYGHGYYNQARDWRTIMSYDCPGGCDRTIYWSNPKLRLLGQPVGTYARHNNVRVLNQTAARVANFRRGAP